MSPPKAVCLDVGWTLVYPRASLWDIFADVVREAGSQMMAVEAERLINDVVMATRPQAVEEFHRGAEYADSDEAFLALFETMSRGLFTFAGIGGDHEALTGRFLRRFWNPDNWVVFDDVIAAIERLRARGVRVGVLSNASSDLVDFLERLGLLPHFDFTVVSALEGTKKPDPRIFAHALRRAGTAPEETVHVGDMYIEDVLGPRRVGVRPLLMERGTRAMFPHFPESERHPAERFEIVRGLDDVLAAVGLAS